MPSKREVLNQLKRDELLAAVDHDPGWVYGVPPAGNAPKLISGELRLRDAERFVSEDVA
jgi:hypothetical protein